MSQELKPGTTLYNGTYRIKKMLGSGSFGITYLASTKVNSIGGLGKLEFEVKVAVKEFFISQMNCRSVDGSSVEMSGGSLFNEYQRKFRREAENLSRLKHDNIIRVTDIFSENNTSYYVMEFIDGITLDDYITSRGHLTEAETKAAMETICRAVEYMHSCLMLHLDIKPRNIMRRDDGSYVLIDFGLSKQFSTDGDPETSTTIGLGTPGYAPMEQSTYQRDSTFPATLDVYALGATMFKMLTGKRPPVANDIFNDGFPEQALKSHGVSDSTISIVRKAMSPARKDRYQSVADLRHAIRQEPADATAIIAPTGDETTESVENNDNNQTLHTTTTEEENDNNNCPTGDETTEFVENNDNDQTLHTTTTEEENDNNPPPKPTTALVVFIIAILFFIIGLIAMNRISQKQDHEGYEPIEGVEETGVVEGTECTDADSVYSWADSVPIK